MMDMKKVIKGLECHTKKNVCMNHCPYCDGTGCTEMCTSTLIHDALALLKTQEGLLGIQQTPDMEKVIKEWEAVLSRDPLDAPWDLIDDTLTLLKEQEGTINELQNAYGYLQKQFFEAQDKLLKEQDNCENCAIAIEDRQPVVRCKDCKHYRINTVYPGTNMIMKYCAKTGIAENKPDWYCADGERR